MAIIDYLKEATKSKNIFNVEEIKKYLYESEGHDSWEEFVDRQRLGDCQSIVSDIKRKYPFVKSVFGEIEIDEPYYDEEGEVRVVTVDIPWRTYETGGGYSFEPIDDVVFDKRDITYYSQTMSLEDWRSDY